MDEPIITSSSVSSETSAVSSPPAEIISESEVTAVSSSAETISESVVYQTTLEAETNNSEFQSSVLNSLIVIIVLLGSILGAFLVRLLRK